MLLLQPTIRRLPNLDQLGLLLCLRQRLLQQRFCLPLELIKHLIFRGLIGRKIIERKRMSTHWYVDRLLRVESIGPNEIAVLYGHHPKRSAITNILQLVSDYPEILLVLAGNLSQKLVQSLL